MNGGTPTCRSPHLSVLIRVNADRRPLRLTRRFTIPCWTSRQELNLRSTRVRSAELFL